jgi:glycosyltransferase involved in cell wall biosynthesis
MFFSIIIPVYNRPNEIGDLLESLTLQVNKDFEVIVIEDGSKFPSEQIVTRYQEKLQISYYYQENKGQGFARNLGLSCAKGNYFVFFDSDCIIPKQYLALLYHALNERKLDAHGGPDDAGEDFTPLQKAMNFSMTSFWTTGGIRGKLKDPAKYQARGYNMGFSRKVYQEVGGFIDPNMAEDIELSIRIKKAGFKLELVKEAYVFHRRKNTYISFLRQSFQFGRNRIHVGRFHPEAVQAVHLLPLGFLLGSILLLLSAIWLPMHKLKTIPITN